jgi:Ca2+/Na+ antiporter
MDTNSNIFDYSITPATNHNFREAARWCRFLSIVGFIFLGLLLLGGTLGAPALISVFNTMLPGNFQLVAGALIAVIIVAVLFGVFLFMLLYRFATFTRKAMELKDESLFIKGVQSLKLYFIIYGVIGMLSVLGNLTSYFG